MLAVLLFSSCRKDDIVDTNVIPPPTADIFYEADVIGKIVDQDGNALEGVSINVGDRTVSTDVNGLFRMKNLELSANQGTYFEAIAEGYFESGYRIYAGGTYDRTVEFALVKKEISGYVNGATGDVITLSGGLEIDFPANAFTANGGDYNGLVTVHAYHLDPSEDNYLDRSPGDLSGTDETGANYILESFGMIAVEMETADGQFVQIKDGVSATLTVPVDNSLLGDAPAIIPLWHFDDIQHKWVREGQADLINGRYVGQVSHFSWWNCDAFTDAASLCIQVFDGRYQGSLQGLIVELTSETQGVSADITDSQGNVSGQVPSNEVFEITIYDQCGNVVYTGSIGPFTGTGNKEVIPLFLNDVDIYGFSGNVFDCETMSPLSEAIITIYVEGNTYYTETDNNGTYSIGLLICEEGAEYAIIAFSADAGMAGAESGVATIEGVNVLDVNLCDDTPFFNINDENGQLLASLFNPRILEKTNETIVLGEIGSGGTNLSHILGFSGNTIGTFPASFLGNNLNANNENCTVTITQYTSGIGGTVKGTLSGTDAFTGNSFTGSFSANIVE